MAYLDEMVAESRRRERRLVVLGDVAVVVATIAVALVAWVLWTQAGGVELVVHGAEGTREVVAGDAVVAGAVAGVGGVGLAWAMMRLLPSGLRWWTVVAWVVLLLSMLGPFGAATPAAVLALASLHVVVGLSVIVGVRWVHRDAPGRAVAA